MQKCGSLDPTAEARASQDCRCGECVGYFSISGAGVCGGCKEIIFIGMWKIELVIL